MLMHHGTITRAAHEGCLLSKHDMFSGQWGLGILLLLLPQTGRSGFWFEECSVSLTFICLVLP